MIKYGIKNILQAFYSNRVILSSSRGNIIVPVEPTPISLERCVLIDASTVQPYEMTNLRIQITPGQYLVDGSLYYNIFEYSYDGDTWNRIADSGEIIDLGWYKKVYMRGICGDNQFVPQRIKITADTINLDRGRVAIYGNFNSLLKYNASDINNINNIVVGYGLFMDSNALTSAGNLLMPQMDLGTNCYRSLFEGCTSLKTPPTILPATNLKSLCYANMFENCSSLLATPKLVATTLVANCYNSMFENCSSLSTITNFPEATIIEGSSCKNMFNNCTSLTTAPEKLCSEYATLHSNCCNSMFSYCTSLTTAPEIPIVNLDSNAGYAFQNMFAGCTSLTKAPSFILFNSIPNEYICNSMFYGCTSLTTAPELLNSNITGIYSEGCYSDMFAGCTNLNYIKCLLNVSNPARFTGNWVNGVSPTGTFVKNPSMTYWETGDSDIPSGWTVVDA